MSKSEAKSSTKKQTEASNANIAVQIAEAAPASKREILFVKRKTGRSRQLAEALLKHRLQAAEDARLLAIKKAEAANAIPPKTAEQIIMPAKLDSKSLSFMPSSSTKQPKPPKPRSEIVSSIAVAPANEPAVSIVESANTVTVDTGAAERTTLEPVEPIDVETAIADYDWNVAEAEMVEASPPAEGSVELPPFEYVATSELDLDADELWQMLGAQNIREAATIDEVNPFEAAFLPPDTNGGAESVETASNPEAAVALEPVEKTARLQFSETIVASFLKLETTEAAKATEVLLNIRTTIADLVKELHSEQPRITRELTSDPILGLLIEDIANAPNITMAEQVVQLKEVVADLLDQLNMPYDETTVLLLLRTLMPAELLTALPQLQNDPPQWIIDEAYEKMKASTSSDAQDDTPQMPINFLIRSGIGRIALIVHKFHPDDNMLANVT